MKTAIVTGASIGIGRAVALEFAKNDYEVFLVARRVENLDETKKMVEDANGKAKVFPADLSSIESINTLISEIKNSTNQIDVIANIAGIWHGDNEVYAGKDFQDFDQKVIIDTFTVGTVAPAIIVHGLLPLMKSGSKVINLSGTFENGGKGWLPYFISKRSIEDFTVGLSEELADKNIQVNCISPSDTATEEYAKYFPQYIDDAIQPSEIASQFISLADPSNKVTGKVFVMKKGSDPTESFHF